MGPRRRSPSRAGPREPSLRSELVVSLSMLGTGQPYRPLTHMASDDPLSSLELTLDPQGCPVPLTAQAPLYQEEKL